MSLFVVVVVVVHRGLQNFLLISVNPIPERGGPSRPSGFHGSAFGLAALRTNHLDGDPATAAASVARPAEAGTNLKLHFLQRKF